MSECSHCGLKTGCDQKHFLRHVDLWATEAEVPPDVIVGDVTKEIDAEHELRRANVAAATRLALLSALIDAIEVGVILVDRELNVAHWNKEATRLTGIPAENMLGKPATVLGQAIGPRVEDYPSVEAHLVHAFDPAATTHLPIVLLEPRREVDLTVSPALLPSNGGQVGFVIVLHDVTAVKDLEHAKDELIGMVSHELRTPLTSIAYFGANGPGVSDEMGHPFRSKWATPVKEAKQAAA